MFFLTAGKEIKSAWKETKMFFNRKHSLLRKNLEITNQCFPEKTEIVFLIVGKEIKSAWKETKIYSNLSLLKKWTRFPQKSAGACEFESRPVLTIQRTRAKKLNDVHQSSFTRTMSMNPLVEGL